MKMAKFASKAAAILCAAAVMVPTTAIAVSANTVTGTVLAAAATSAVPDWNVVSITGDQYVANGKSFSFTVNVGSWVKNATYQWQVMPAGSNSWTNISGATSATVKGTMSDAYNLALVRCVVVDTDRNKTEESAVRTLSNIAASAKLGTPVLQSDGYYKIPLGITGLKDNAIASFVPNFTVDTASIDDIDWEYSSKLANDGDQFGFGFFQANKPIDNDGDGKTDKVEKVANSYVLQHTTVTTPTVLGSDKVLGYLYVKPKSGVKTLTIGMSAYNGNPATLTGDNYRGNIVYGMSYTGTTIGASTTSTTVPQNLTVTYSEEFHQMRFTWDKVPNATQYGIAVMLAGKWRVQTSNITTNSYTTPKNMTPGMTYRVAVAAKVNGAWDTAGAIKNAITVTVK